MRRDYRTRMAVGALGIIGLAGFIDWTMNPRTEAALTDSLGIRAEANENDTWQEVISNFDERAYEKTAEGN